MGRTIGAKEGPFFPSLVMTFSFLALVPMLVSDAMTAAMTAGKRASPCGESIAIMDERFDLRIVLDGEDETLSFCLREDLYRLEGAELEPVEPAALRVARRFAAGCQQRRGYDPATTMRVMNMVAPATRAAMEAVARASKPRSTAADVEHAAVHFYDLGSYRSARCLFQREAALRRRGRGGRKGGGDMFEIINVRIFDKLIDQGHTCLGCVNIELDRFRATIGNDRGRGWRVPGTGSRLNVAVALNAHGDVPDSDIEVCWSWRIDQEHKLSVSRRHVNC